MRRIYQSHTKIESCTTRVLPKYVQEDLIMWKFYLNINSSCISFRLFLVKSPWPSAVCKSDHMKLSPLSKSVHTRLVHSRRDLCLFRCSDVLDRRGDGGLIVEL
jgi:uncharacterized Zn-finger protein